MDHAKSQQAREFLRTYVNGNRKLITDWLDGSALGNAEEHRISPALQSALERRR